VFFLIVLDLAAAADVLSHVALIVAIKNLLELSVGLKKLLGQTCSATVINDDNPDDDSGWIPLEENAWISLASLESALRKCENELAPKGKHRLNKTVECLEKLEPIDVRVVVAFESFQDFHVDLFSILEFAVEKAP
jgi:hypothetical protein